MTTEIYKAFPSMGIEESKAVPSQENLATKEDLSHVQTNLKDEFRKFRQDMLKMEMRLMVRFGGMLTVAVGIIIAVLKYL